MKCENCGKEEVCFHYTSNINGNITEKHLCAECAVKLGFDKKPGPDGGADESEKSFEEIFAELFGFAPNKKMLGGYGMVFPTFIIPTVGVLVPGGKEPQSMEPRLNETALTKPAVDEEMKKRREVNILREQMRQAAEAEDFEKAAELRDSIKKLENGVNS